VASASLPWNNGQSAVVVAFKVEVSSGQLEERKTPFKTFTETVLDLFSHFIKMKVL
jgi:hypothetical protein